MVQMMKIPNLKVRPVQKNLTCLAEFCAHRVWKQKRKALHFCTWPLTQFQVEAFLSQLGFKILSIKETHKQSELDKLRLAFNRKSHKSEILITSIRVGPSFVTLLAETAFYDLYY